MQLPELRIFVSSPGDVSQERIQAERVIDRLALELGHRARLRGIFWEHEPLRATESFQTQIPRPSDADIVVTILWSRIGTRLPANVVRPEGTPYQSGTEFEFEDAIAGWREPRTPRRPDLIVYRKTSSPVDSLPRGAEINRRLIEEWLTQKEALDRFVAKYLRDAEAGTFIAAFYPFESAADFERQLELHLRQFIEERLRSVAPEREIAPRPRPIWTSGSPFRGLECFDKEHARIFFGRTAATDAVLANLRRKVASGSAFVLVTGGSGSGKSSLVRAGVLPLLTRPGVLEVLNEAPGAVTEAARLRGVGLWRDAVLLPGRGEGDLIDGLVRALAEALPELLASGVSIERLAADLRDTPGSAGPLLRQALAHAGEVVRREETLESAPIARLALVIDQLEEIFTHPTILADERRRFSEAIEALARSGAVVVIATLRTDFVARLESDDVRALATLKQGGEFQLMPPSEEEVEQMIRLPALAAGLIFEVDPETGHSLFGSLVSASAARADLLPLLEFTLEELYRARSSDRPDLLTWSAYRTVGRLEGAIASRAETIFEALGRPEKAFRSILRELVEPGEKEGAPATRRVALLTAVARDPVREAFVKAFIEARLFVTDATADGTPTIRVAHEALLRQWPLAVAWLRENDELLRVRGQVRKEAARWESEARRGDLLAGRKLEEAVRLALDWPETLSSSEEAFIRASEAQDWRNLWAWRGLVAALAILALLASVAAVLSNRSERESQRRLVANHITQAIDGVRRGDAMQALRWLTQALVDGRGVIADDRSLRISTGLFLRDSAVASRPLVPSGTTTAASGAAAIVDVEVLGVSRSGSRLVTRSGDRALHVWDLTTARIVANLVVSEGAIRAAALDSSGMRLAVAAGGRLQIRDLETSQELWPDAAPAPHVETLAFSPDDERLLITASASVEVREASSGRQIGPTFFDDGPLEISVDSVVTPPSSDPERSDAIAPSEETTEHRKDSSPTLQEEKIEGASSVSLSADGRKVVTATEGAAVTVWDAPTGKALSEALQFSRPLSRVTFSPSGDRLLVEFDDGEISLWDWRAGRPFDVASVQRPFWYGEPNGIDLAPLVVFAGPGAFRTVDRESFEPRSGAIPNGSSPALARVSPDGSKIALADGFGGLWVFDAASSSTLCPMLGHPLRLDDVWWPPDARHLVTRGSEGVVRVWDLGTCATPGEVAPLSETAAAGGRLQLSRDGSAAIFFSGDSDGVEVRSTATGDLLMPPIVEDDRLQQFRLSSDGRRAVAAVGKARVRVQTFDTTTGEIVGPEISPGDRLRDVALSRSGTRLAFRLGNERVTAWDPVTGAVAGPEIPVTGGVRGEWLSPDGDVLAVKAAPRTLELRAVGTGELVCPAFVLPSNPREVAWSGDSKALAITYGSYQSEGLRLIRPAVCAMSADAPVSGPIARFALGDRGRRLLVVSEVGRVEVLDTEQLVPLSAPLWTGPGLTDVVLSPDESFVAGVLGEDEREASLALWDAGTGAPLGTSPVFVWGEVRALAFDSSSTILVAISHGALPSAPSHSVLARYVFSFPPDLRPADLLAAAVDYRFGLRRTSNGRIDPLRAHELAALADRLGVDGFPELVIGSAPAVLAPTSKSGP